MVSILGELDQSASAVVMADEEVVEARSILGVVYAATMNEAKLRILYPENLEENVEKILERIKNVLE